MKRNYFSWRFRFSH